MASFMARVYLQRASDAVARDIGIKEVDGFPREGAQVAFAHDGKMVLGRLHAIDRTGGTPTIIVR